MRSMYLNTKIKFQFIRILQTATWRIPDSHYETQGMRAFLQTVSNQTNTSLLGKKSEVLRDQKKSVISPTSFWYSSDSFFLQKSQTAAAITRYIGTHVKCFYFTAKVSAIKINLKIWSMHTPSVFSTALQPIQVLLFWANAMRPPTFEVNTVLQRVWSPSERCQKCHYTFSEHRSILDTYLSHQLHLLFHPSQFCSINVTSVSQTYWAGHSLLCSLPGWAQIFWAGAWTAAAPGSIVCRWEYCSPAHRSGPKATCERNHGSSSA